MKLPVLICAQIFALVFSPLWFFVVMMSPLALANANSWASYIVFALFNLTPFLIICFSIAMWIAWGRKMPALQKVSAIFLFLSPLPLLIIL